MIRLSALLPLAVAALIAPVPAAWAATACDHIQNPYEFNKCLAAQSPVRGKARASAPQEEGVAAGRPGRVRSVRRGGRVSSVILFGGSPVQRTGSGRKRITFDVRGR